MKVRIVECVGSVSGHTYWQVQKRYWWWPFWKDFGQMQGDLATARRMAEVAAKPPIYYVED